MEYLTSNQNLELNKTFKIYLKILSIDHMQARAKKKKRRPIGKLHVGTNGQRNPIHYWSLNAPPIENFANHCLLIATIFSLLQHEYFKSDKKDKRYLKILQCNSKSPKKRNAATKLIKNELGELFSVTGLKTTGPYQLQTTIKLLCQSYKCQFFVFDGLANSSKLCYLYPSDYDDSLKPVFLYKPSNTDDHIIFIRHINSYFKNNFYICFGCKKKFKYPKRMHMCPKRSTCFACRRIFMSPETYVHQDLLHFFCDKFVTIDKSYLCKICGCTINSTHCYNGHKILCNGVGHFGFKCHSHCKRFFYSNNHQTSQQLREAHNCFDFSICKYCYVPKEPNHLCKLRWPQPILSHNRLCFFNIIFSPNDENYCPLLAIFFREELYRGNFTKYCFIDERACNSNCEDIVNNYITFNYFHSATSLNNLEFDDLYKRKKKKITEDFRRNCSKLKCSELGPKILKFILDEKFCHTSFVCNSSTTQPVLVSLYFHLRHLYMF